MEIIQKFALNAPPERVWVFLTDPYQVASCLPGAAITEKIDERTYWGTLAVKIGPVVASYKGKICFERLDPRTHEAEIVSQGQEVKGKGSAEMRLMTHLYPLEDGGTEITIQSQVHVIGLLAQLGRGMIQDVSDQLFKQFTVRMKTALEAETPIAQPPRSGGVEPVNALSLGSKALGRAVGRTVRRLFGFSKP